MDRITNNSNDDDGLDLLDLFSTLVSACYTLLYLFFTLPSDIDTINIPISQRKELSFREVKSSVLNHTVKKQKHQDVAGATQFST